MGIPTPLADVMVPVLCSGYTANAFITGIQAQLCGRKQRLSTLDQSAVVQDGAEVTCRFNQVQRHIRRGQKQSPTLGPREQSVDSQQPGC